MDKPALADAISALCCANGIKAGTGGLAVAVHSTQFEIRLPQHALSEPVLGPAAETINAPLSRPTDASEYWRRPGNFS